MRRSTGDPADLAYFAVHARQNTTLPTIVNVAGMRWGVEDCFGTAKSDCGLDQYEVRHWEPWHRHIALSIAAFAFLSVTATRTTQGHADGTPDNHHGRRRDRPRHNASPVAAAEPAAPARQRPALIPYTAEEIRRLLHQTLWHVHHHDTVVAAQSLWRRAHQALAHRIHYEHRRRQTLESHL
ncbi:hypothetical protein [Streptomyces sp. NPDC001774]